MAIRAAIYARTSPDCPIPADKQVELLKSVGVLHGWTIERVFIDRPTTARGPDRRPDELALISAIRSGVIEKVLVWSIDRVGHSLTELVGFLEACRAAHVSLWVDQQSIDTEQSSVLFDVGAVMALHLHQSRRDRILRGQARRGASRSGSDDRRSLKSSWTGLSRFYVQGKECGRRLGWREYRRRLSAD
jgi:DNA invertase Pin-like site-specific DNA recombinase